MKRLDANIKRVFIFGLAITALGFASLFLLKQRFEDADRYNRYCVTNVPIIVHGNVVDQSGQPIINAEVKIQNISLDESICPDFPYISEISLNTNEGGEFHTSRSAQPDQYFNITISAEGCSSYEARNLPFLQFYLPSEIPEFSLGCDN